MNVYLDYAATAPLDPEVLEKMLPLLKENFGNPDSLHAFGRRAAYAVGEARDRVANILGVKPGEVYFTSGGTEADNWAVRMLGSGGVCISAVEHQAVRSAAALREGGFTVANVNQDGLVTAEAVSRAMDENTGLVAVMAVNNETGCVQPLEEISSLCRERGVLLFSDCVQAACTLGLRGLAALTDAFSLSGHKLYGPKGTGVLVVKRGTIKPLIAGGEQERSLRGGTLNAAGIVGFSFALEKAQREREAFVSHTKKLRELFEREVFAAFGERVQRDGENRIASVSHLTFRAGGEALLNKLDLNGIAVSGGAACSAHSALPSHVLLAMGRSEEEARRGIRFSFGRETTEEEVLYAVRTLKECCGM